MDKRAFLSIRRLIERAQRGLAFPEAAIQILREDIINLASSNDSFASVIRLFNLLYRLSLVENARELSSSSFVDVREENEDDRVRQVKEYIMTNLIDYRLGIAARLLLTTRLSVAEIGYSCGFNTLSHFNRLFKESKGCTPSEFRERF